MTPPARPSLAQAESRRKVCSESACQVTARGRTPPGVATGKGAPSSRSPMPCVSKMTPPELFSTRL